MSIVWRSVAWFWAGCHLALIVLLIVGGPLGRRWPWIWRIHLPALVATAAVNIVGADCPLTTWQKAAIVRSGGHPYMGGFIEHYLVDPLWSGGMTPGVKLAILASWVVPTIWGYSAWLARRRTTA